MFYHFDTHTETIIYKYKWVFIDYPHLKVTECGKIINVKTGREKKICLNGYSKGVWATPKKFITNLNNHITIIT